MEALMNAITKSCKVSSEDGVEKDQENDCFRIRKSQFKQFGRTSDAAREERRAKLLEEYRKRRDALLNEKRGLLFEDFDDNDDLMDWEVGLGKKITPKCIRASCKNQLMMSEWLLDWPSDLETNWICMFCPEGRRTLVIAKRGTTRAYHKQGYLLAKFNSILPNGNKSNILRYSDSIILDCIWKEKTKQLFVLDVLYWVNQPLLNCDAEFRLYWLANKLKEVKNAWYSTSQDPNVYNVFIPHQCPVYQLEQSLATYHAFEVDGILFYHKRVPYVSGHTPLVGWLKPYMLPERFGISVPKSYLSLKPPTYVNLEQWVDTLGHQHVRKQRKKSKADVKKTSSKTKRQPSASEMEVIENVPATTNSPDVSTAIDCSEV